MNQEQEKIQENVQSAEEIRFEQVKQAEYASHVKYVDGRYNTKESAHDNAHVAAWLDKLARRRQLRVERSLIDDDEYAFHSVQILHENENGEVVPIECGGWVEMYELHRGYMDGPGWLYKKEEVSDGWVRIKLMIGDIPEDEFKKKIQQREKARQRKTDIHQVIEMLRAVLLDLFQDFAHTKNTDTLYLSLRELQTHYNETLDKVSKRYSSCAVPTLYGNFSAH